MNPPNDPPVNEPASGRQLLLRFVELEMPDCYQQVVDMFRGRGAYRRFRMLLEAHNLVERWQRYEQDAMRHVFSELMQRDRLPGTEE